MLFAHLQPPKNDISNTLKLFGYPTNISLAYVFVKRKDSVFKELKILLTPLKIEQFYTDDK